MSKQDKATRLSLAKDIAYRASEANKARELSKEDSPEIETEWGTASVDSGAPEVMALKESIRKAEAEQELEDSSLGGIAWDALKTSNFIGETGNDAYLDYIANTERDYDPNFDAKDLLVKDSMFYDDKDKDFLLDSKSLGDYNNRKELLNERDMSVAKLIRLGGYGEFAMLLAGLFDIDMLIPGGKAVGYAAKGNKLKGAMKYAKNGSEMARLKKMMRANTAKKYADVAFTAGWQNAAVASLEKMQGNHVTLDDIVSEATVGVAMSPIVTAMSSKMFGGGEDAFHHYKYSEDALNTIFEREGALQTGRESIFDNITLEGDEVTLYNVISATKQLYNTKDAKGKKLKKPERLDIHKVYPEAPIDTTKLPTASSKIRDIIDASQIIEKERKESIDKAYRSVPDFEKNFVKSEQFDKFANAITGDPMFTRGLESDNIVLKAMTYNLVSDPKNLVSNINNADFIGDQVRTKGKSFIQDSDVYFNNYAKRYVKGMSRETAFKQELTGGIHSKFAEEVQLEAQARRHGKGHYTDDPDVISYVDNLYNVSDYLVDEFHDINHGGENKVSGTEDLKKIPYVPRRFVDRGIRLKQGKLGEAEVLNKFSESICRGYNDYGLSVDMNKAKIFAKAIIHNATHRDSSKPFDTTLSNEYAVEQLLANGMSLEDANNLVKTIFKVTEGSTAPKFTKFRIPMDYSVQFSDGSTIASLLDPDLSKTMNGYINNAAGRIGLARVGIHSDTEFSAIEEAAEFVDGELKKKGAIIKHPAKKQLQDMKNLLLGYPLDTESPWATRAVNTTNLFTMWKAGLTQVVEFAPMMASFGIENTIGNAIDVIKSSFKNGKRVALLDDVTSFTGNAFFDDYTMGALNIENLDMDNIPKNHYFWEVFDMGLRKGLSVQQTFNLMKPVMTVQRKAAVCSMMNTLNKHIREGSFDSVRGRLSDWGITDELFDKVNTEWNKHVQISADGKRVENLHLNEWDVNTAEEFMRAVRRAMDTVIMKPHIGEQRGWVSTPAGRLIAQFKTYPLLALNKFTTTGIRHWDAQTLNTFLISLTLAPLVYAAKVQLSTSDDAERANKMTWDKVVYNSLSYNVNLGSFADPVSILGDLIGIKTTPYSKGVFDAAGYAMPSLNVLPVLASPIKAGMQKMTRGNLTKQTFAQLQQATIVGNMLGVSRLYESVFGAPLSRDAQKIQKAMDAKTAERQKANKAKKLKELSKLTKKETNNKNKKANKVDKLISASEKGNKTAKKDVQTLADITK